MPKLRKIAGAWRSVADRYRKVDGVWRKVLFSYRKIDGVWKMVFGSRTEMVSTFAEDNPNFHGSLGTDWDATANKYRVWVNGNIYGAQSMILGLIVDNIPAGSTVALDWSGAKNYVEHMQIMVDTGDTVLLTQSETFARRTDTFNNVSGSMRVYIKFSLGSPVGEVSFDLFGLSINGARIF